VSDFLSRVAARAVGEAPVARPRLPSAFEDGGIPGDAALEVVDAEISAAGAPRPADVPLPAAGRDTPTPVPNASGPVTPKIPSGKPEPVVHATQGHPDQAAQASRVATGERVQRRPEPELAPAAPRSVEPGRVAPAPVAGVPEGAAVPVAVPTAIAAPVTSVVSTPLRAPALAPADAAHAAVESPAVRVHIGRLEVRANLQQPAPSEPARGEGRPQELSLADYLRGKRVAS